MTRVVVFVLLSAITLMAASTKDAPKADTIYINGNVYMFPDKASQSAEAQSGGGPAPSTPAARPQAFAVRDGVFLAVGSNAEITKLKGKQTTVVDLQGRFVMPGFNDAHLHLASGGMEKLNVSLAGVKSLAEMKQRIAAAVAAAAPGDWIQGRGWDHTVWPGQELPTRQDLDAVTGDHPAVFGRVDGHIAIANSAALRAAKIGKETPDPEGGKIDRDQAGEPTGILRESAWTLVQNVIPKPSPARRRQGIELALADAAQWGITSVQDNSDWEDFLVYEELQREGKLTARIAEWLPFEEKLSLLQQHRAHHAATDALLHTSMLKAYMDGSLGSRTAALQKPYEDDPQNVGIPQYEPGTLNKMASERTAVGFQLGFHAIGDRGVGMALDAFEESLRYAREHNPTGRDVPPQRFRIEHAQVVAPEDFRRFRELGVIASMQPNHLLTDMKWALSRLGTSRARYSYAWREFLDNGVELAFGTDYPVEPITPFRGLYAAVTRSDERGIDVYFPPQKLTIDEAIRAYTLGSAYAEFAEKAKGAIREGMLADFVVLDRDITRVSPQELLKTKVLQTVVGGKTVYEAK